MRGTTNALPAGGGLKVIAEGTVNLLTQDQNISLAESADYLLYTVISTSNNNRQTTYLIPRNSEGSGLTGTITFSPDGKMISFTWDQSSMEIVAMTYLALKTG